MSLSIFLSHAWDDFRKYGDAVNLLNATFENWQNTSIPENEAIYISSDLTEQLEQTREHVVRCKDHVEARKDDLLPMHDALLAQINALKIRRHNFEKLRGAENALAEANKAFHDPKQNERVAVYSDQVRHYKKLCAEDDIRELEGKISALHEQLQPIRSKIESFDVEISRYSGALMRKTAALVDIGKPRRDRIVERYPALTAAIHERIRRSDYILIIFAQNTAYRQWMEFEYMESFLLRKPLYALVHPDGPTELPPDLRGFAIRPLPWDSEVVRQKLTPTN